MYNHQLDAFLAAAELGSFGKAAEKLYISTPAVIQQVNLLEERMGFPLFLRSNRGVQLTGPGQVLYRQARAIVQMSGDAVAEARALAQAQSHTVRIGTSLLFKCRMLPDLWAVAAEKCPGLKLELLPMPEHGSRQSSHQDLGSRYDIREGIFCTISQKDTCNFLELRRTPLCCAVSRDHRLAGYRRLTMEDLNGEILVMPIKDVSAELDKFRQQIQQDYPTVKILDSSYYGIDTFALCEINPYILITQEIYRDIHPDLVTVPLETDITLPYGLMYSLSPSLATRKFIEAVK